MMNVNAAQLPPRLRIEIPGQHREMELANRVQPQAAEAPPQNLTFGEKFAQLGVDFRRNQHVINFTRVAPVLVQGGSAVVNITSSKALTLLFRIFSGKPGNDSGGGDWTTAPSTVKLVGQARLCVVIGAIVALVDMVGEAIEIADEVRKAENDPDRLRERNDAILRFIDAFATLGDCSSSFAKGLIMAGYIAENAINWAMPLGVVSAGLSLIAIAIHARGIQQSNEILDKLNGNIVDANGDPVEDNLDNKLNWLADELQNREKDGEIFLKRHFEVLHRDQYAAQVIHIIRTQNDNDKTQLLEALKDRISEKIVSHRLGIVCVIIAVIATIIIFFPALGPAMLGYGLAFGGAFLSFVKYVLTRRSVHRLEAKIDELCPSEILFQNENRQWIERNAPFAMQLLPEENLITILPPEDDEVPADGLVHSPDGLIPPPDGLNLFPESADMLPALPPEKEEEKKA